jgi:hypothetical protein
MFIAAARDDDPNSFRSSMCSLTTRLSRSGVQRQALLNPILV